MKREHIRWKIQTFTRDKFSKLHMKRKRNYFDSESELTFSD